MQQDTFIQEVHASIYVRPEHLAHFLTVAVNAFLAMLPVQAAISTALHAHHVLVATCSIVQSVPTYPFVPPDTMKIHR